MINAYVGCAIDSTVRYMATSGGVGSYLLKYLFDKGEIHTAITFDYDNEILKYVPRLIYKYEDYKMTGSIYHEINLIQFVKEHINEIKGEFACFVLPCQARAIRSILERSNVNSILIGLTCSSQQDLEATYYLIKYLNINRDEVTFIQYRGNGWPSGIQIIKKDGTKIFVPNNNSIWTQIFHSRLFILPRCFECQNTLNIYSDIVLADPWLKEYVIKEKERQTLFGSYTNRGQSIIMNAINNGYITAKSINENAFTSSQYNTIVRKNGYKNHPNIKKRMKKIFTSSYYKSIVLASASLFKIHCMIKNKMERCLLYKTVNK